MCATAVAYGINLILGRPLGRVRNYFSSKDSMKDLSAQHKSCQKGKDSRVEYAEDYSAYPDLATIGEQQHALKRTMRTHADAVHCESKIGLTVIG